MPTGKHYFIEKNDAGKFAVKARGAECASGIFDTQREATARAKELVPNDKPDVERVGHTSGGDPDKWRSSRR
jgi:hypothetical protein